MNLSEPFIRRPVMTAVLTRSEEHTSELQSQSNLVCRLLLETKNNTTKLQSHSNLGCRLVLDPKLLDDCKSHIDVPVLTGAHELDRIPPAAAALDIVDTSARP